MSKLSMDTVIEQLKTSKEFAFVDDNPRMEAILGKAIEACEEKKTRDIGCEFCGPIEDACNDCVVEKKAHCWEECERLAKYSLQKKIHEQDTFCRKCGRRLRRGPVEKAQIIAADLSPMFK